MTESILGWNNYVISSSLQVGSSAASMPAENLQDDTGSPSVAWQTAYGVTTSTLTIAPPIIGLSWRAFGLFRTNLTAAAVVTVRLYSEPSTLVWTGTAAGPAPGYGQSIVVAPSDLTADRCVITIADPANMDGFLNIPLAFAGPVWSPASGPTWQSTMGRDSLTDEVISRGGQEFPTLRWQRRRWEIAFDGLRTSEVWDDAQEVDRLSRAGGNMLFAPDIASATLAREAVFGRLESVADISYIAGFFDRRAWRFRVRERI